MLTPARADLKADGPSCTLWYIAMRAGRSEKSGGWLLSYVRLLHLNEGFPPPLPDYVLKTGKRKEGIHLESRWVREAVDAWFNQFLPPELVAVAEDMRQRRDAETLDQRAALLAVA